MSNRKTRGDSKLDALQPAQQEQLAEWLTVENITYAEARARCADQFGVSTSLSALQAFYARFAAPWKYTRARGEAETFAQLMEGQFDAATIKRAKQLAFDALANPKPDLNSAQTLLKIVGESAKLSLQERKLLLDAEKFRQMVKSEAEKGLDALHAELAHDPVALALFEQMRARVMATLEAKSK